MKMRAFKAALPYTLPICIGFLALGLSYGFLMQSKGFSWLYPLFMSLLILQSPLPLLVTTNWRRFPESAR